MIWLSRNFLFVTVTLIVSILLFSSQVTAKECKIITKTRDYTKTIYPSNCPEHCTTITLSSPTTTITTTTTSTTTSTTTTITTTTTTTTTTTPSPPLPPVRKRFNTVACILDKSIKDNYINY